MRRMIQEGVFPNHDLCSEEKMFFRNNSDCKINGKTKELYLFKSGCFDTSTYFNGLSVGKWKRNTNIDHLLLSIKFQGRVKITFKIKKIGYSDVSLLEEIIEHSTLKTSDIELPFWKSIDDGMLYFEIFSFNDSLLTGFQYMTDTPPVSDIKLGIVITHFNRQEYIMPALDRLKTSLLNDPQVKDKVAVIVVDNSQNLADIEGITIIKNKNLGGAGGFSRGLIYLKDSSLFTHCLFMDDDASCDMTSIKRTLTLLESTENKQLAISGAMLTEREVYRQYESGAVFNGTCKSIDKGLNMLLVLDLLKNERQKQIGYGAWWFFAFSIAGTKHNAFPYFVRGDDISFSLSNHFDIQTLNGICSWQPDFGAKSNPMSIYLDVRNHLMHPLHGLVKSNSVLSMIKSAILIYGYQIVGYHYDSAKAAIIAVQDVLKGPDFWHENADMVNKRAEINAILEDEKPVLIPENLYAEGVRAQIENITTSYDISDRGKQINLSSLLRYITLNGHIIPQVFFKKGFVWLRKSLGSRMSSVFLYSKAIFLIDDTDKCVILKHSKKKFFSYSFQFFLELSRLAFRFKSLQKQYIESYADLTSDEFWRTQFEEKNTEGEINHD